MATVVALHLVFLLPLALLFFDLHVLDGREQVAVFAGELLDFFFKPVHFSLDAFHFRGQKNIDQENCGFHAAVRVQIVFLFFLLVKRGCWLRNSSMNSRFVLFNLNDDNKFGSETNLSIVLAMFFLFSSCV